MKISQLEIQNFRSIKELVLNPTDLNALLGPNSAGKTNVLRALDLIIGEGWTTKAKVARELFHDPAQPIVIKLTFSSPIEYTNNSGYQDSIYSMRLEMKLEPELSAKTTINDGATFYSQDQFKKRLHFILVPSERQLGAELRVSQWTMLGKLMRLVYENYITKYGGDENNLKEDFSTQIQPAKDFLEDDFSTSDVTYKKFVDTFKKFCQENSAGLANEFEPVLDIYNLNWFYKTLQIHVKEKFPDRHFDSEEVGSGMKNLLLISIFQTYAELMGGRVIFGIEEPEIYLYPQAQRALYKNFIKLSDKTQIFYTSHNPNFVDASRPDDLTMLRKDERRGTYALEKHEYFTDANATTERYRIYTQFNPERNELFFARKALLVEGDSDKILYSSLCNNRWGVDLDAEGISIIACGGKKGVAYFVGVCKLIGFTDYFAVWDKDQDSQPTTLRDALAVSRGLELDPNLEVFLGLPHSESTDKVKNAHEWGINPGSVIPHEFEMVRLFLAGDSATGRDEVTDTIEDSLLEDIKHEDISTDDIPL